MGLQPRSVPTKFPTARSFEVKVRVRHSKVETRRHSQDHQGKPLCWVCVASGSNIEEDELVRCRGCGLHVHIGCYGNLVDPGSDADSVASDEEEPWMCEACCAGVFKPVCALCPNDGGAFKQCDLEETWVRLWPWTSSQRLILTKHCW